MKGLLWTALLLPVMFIAWEWCPSGKWAQGQSGEPPTTTSPLPHFWNRMYQMFHFRFEKELEPPRGDIHPSQTDPMTWTRFPEKHPYLLQGESHQKAIALLDEFLDKNGEKQMASTLHRALLQNDLWALFDWAGNPIWSQLGRKQLPTERRELCQRLARVMSRLALSSVQIAKLPDNYQNAMAAKKYPDQFDSAKKERVFFPNGLLDPNGEWVLLGEWSRDPLATRHTEFFQGRSAFFILLKLPRGREQTLKYLDELRLWKEMNNLGSPPQFPAQTQVALVRRMILINDQGEMVPTRITQSVQMRVFLDPSKAENGSQAFFKFKLDREGLLQGKNGGLALVSMKDEEPGDLLFLSSGHGVEGRYPVMESCQHCHVHNTGPGVLSVLSYTGGFSPGGRRTLVDSQIKRQEDFTLNWKGNQFSWGLFQGYFDHYRQRN